MPLVILSCCLLVIASTVLHYEVLRGLNAEQLAAVTLPAPGTWNLVLEILKGDDLHEVRATTRIRASGDGA